MWNDRKPIICFASAYLDSFLCNQIMLLLLCNSIDCFFRIRNSQLYELSTRPIPFYLKYFAPWLICIVQTLTLIVISVQHKCDIISHVCILSDPNFIIIRSILGFAIPLIASAIFIFITAKVLSDIRRKLDIKCDKDLPKPVNDPPLIPNPRYSCTLEPSKENIRLRQLDFESVPEETESKLVQHHCPQHGLLTFPLQEKSGSLYFDTNSIVYQCSNQPTSSNNHSPDIVLSSNQDCPKTFSLIQQNAVMEFPVRPILIPQPTLSKEAKTIPNTNNSTAHMKRINEFRIERKNSIINLSFCIILIMLWGPYITSTLIQGVCVLPNCPLGISISKINEFKWLSYSSSVIVPLFFLVMDKKVRKTFFNILRCSYEES